MPSKQRLANPLPSIEYTTGNVYADGGYSNSTINVIVSHKLSPAEVISLLRAGNEIHEYIRVPKNTPKNSDEILRYILDDEAFAMFGDALDAYLCGGSASYHIPDGKIGRIDGSLSDALLRAGYKQQAPWVQPKR